MPPVKYDKPVIIFDLGAVLIDWNPRYLYRKLFYDEKEMEYFLSEVCSPAWNAQQDAGRPFAEAAVSLSRRFPQYEVMIAAYFERWEEMIAGEIKGTVEILAELKQAGFSVHALSNWSLETFPLVEHRYAFLDSFGHIVLSGEEQCTKPDSRIYRILLDRIGSTAQACIFIDDSLPNVEAAEALGFRGVHYQTPALLRQQLAGKDPHLSFLL